jgi:hypothetical protein
MNSFTHAHRFETPGFYKCNIVMYQKLLRSADHAYCWQEGISVAVYRLGSNTKHFFSALRQFSVQEEVVGLNYSTM